MKFCHLRQTHTFHYVTEIRQAEEDKEYMFSFVHGSKNDFTEAGSSIVNYQRLERVPRRGRKRGRVTNKQVQGCDWIGRIILNIL